MKIILHSTQAGPKGIRHPGIHDVPDPEAKELIDAGYADAAPTGPEAATFKPAEHAMLPRPRARVAAKPASAPPTPEK